MTKAPAVASLYHIVPEYYFAVLYLVFHHLEIYQAFLHSFEMISPSIFTIFGPFYQNALLENKIYVRFR